MTAGQAVSLRRVRVEGESGSPVSTFARDVRKGLLAATKSLPPRYLYDALGSALYDAITLLPEYYLTRAETEILQAHAGEILEALPNAEIVELGPGSGAKTRILIEAALQRQAIVRYHPIDISEAALRSLAERLAFEYDRLVVTAHAGDYRRVLLGRSPRAQAPALVLFLGSSIGNYEREEAVTLLRGIGGALHAEGALLLGTDLKKNARQLERAYDDSLGVTAAFNRNVLGRINRELGGEFDLNAFRFVVAYDEERGCVDSFQESRVEQCVRIAALDMQVPFSAGERILTESSYKFDDASIDRLAHACGMRVAAVWNDAKERFRLSLLRPASG